MEDNKDLKKYSLIQNIYFFITVGLFALAILTFTLGVINSKALIEMPLALFDLMRIFLVYHFVHFTSGIFVLITLSRNIKQKALELKMVRALLGFLFTPLSFFIMMGAFLLLAFTSCTATI